MLAKIPRSIVVAAALFAAGAAVTEAGARTCQTITHTRWVKQCANWGGGVRCRAHLVTTQQQVCATTLPKVRQTFKKPAKRS